MNLTAENRAHLEALKRLESASHKWRHVNLFLGILLLLIAFGGLAFLSFLPGDAGSRFAGHPLFYVAAIVGGGAIGYAVRGWKGHPAHRLLIAVVEELSRNERNKV